MKKFDLSTLGEILIDFTYAGKSPAGANLFEQNAGGAPANVACAVSKLGGKSAFIGKVGRDMHGEFLKKTLVRCNVDAEGLIMSDDAFTTLAFVSLSESGERSFSFARKPGADTLITPEEVREDIIKDSYVFHFGSLSLTNEPAKSATLYAIETARKNKTIVSYDPNWRPALWEGRTDAEEEIRSVLESVDIIKISDEECGLVCDAKTPEEASEALLNKGISVVIVTCGKDGALIRTKDGLVFSESFKTDVKDTTGAGDSFMGAFLYKISHSKKDLSSLTLDDITEFAAYANAAASVCVSRRGAIDALASREEADAVLKSAHLK